MWFLELLHFLSGDHRCLTAPGSSVWSWSQVTVCVELPCCVHKGFLWVSLVSSLDCIRWTTPRCECVCALIVHTVMDWHLLQRVSPRHTGAPGIAHPRLARVTVIDRTSSLPPLPLWLKGASSGFGPCSICTNPSIILTQTSDFFVLLSLNMSWEPRTWVQTHELTFYTQYLNNSPKEKKTQNKNKYQQQSWHVLLVCSYSKNKHTHPETHTHPPTQHTDLRAVL